MGRLHRFTRFRMCLVCVREQETLDGIPYWKRSHQLPGVLVCHKHECDLIDACPNCGPFRHRNGRCVLPDRRCRNCGYAFGTTRHRAAASADRDGLCKYARLSAELIAANIPPIPAYLRARAYRRVSLWLRPDAVKSAHPRHLSSLVRAEFGSHVLRALGLESGSESFKLPHRVESMITRAHPAIHLLLIGLMFGSVRNFSRALGPSDCWHLY